MWSCGACERVMATKEKPSKATTFSYLTDKFAAGAARVNGGEYPVSGA